jgi:hypothetical protein
MGHSKGWILLEAILCNHPTESWSRWNKEERINISGWFDFSISNLYQFWGWIYHNLIVRDISFVCSEEGNTEFHSIYPQQSVRDTFDFCANSRVRSWMGIFSETTTTCVALSLVWNNHNSFFLCLAWHLVVTGSFLTNIVDLFSIALSTERWYLIVKQSLSEQLTCDYYKPVNCNVYSERFVSESLHSFTPRMLVIGPHFANAYVQPPTQDSREDK